MLHGCGIATHTTSFKSRFYKMVPVLQHTTYKRLLLQISFQLAWKRNFIIWRWLNFFKNLLDCILKLSGEEWSRSRKILDPTFNFSILERFIEVFEDITKVLIRILGQEVGKDEVDLQHILTRYTLDVICSKLLYNSSSEFAIFYCTGHRLKLKDTFTITQSTGSRLDLVFNELDSFFKSNSS